MGTGGKGFLEFSGAGNGRQPDLGRSRFLGESAVDGECFGHPVLTVSWQYNHKEVIKSNDLAEIGFGKLGETILEFERSITS